jgi:hypothetical protein
VNRRNRERRLARRKAQIEPRRRLLVVSEGEVTEREYLQGFVVHCRNTLVSLDYEGPAGVPMTLVGRAKQLKQQAEDLAHKHGDDNLLYDEVWCVFDVDAPHPRIPEAREMARANGMRLAMTNPCFEFWLVLHLRDSPGAQDRHAMQRILQELMPRVQLKHIDFPQIVAGYESAFRRAERIERDAIEAGEVGQNPSTEMFHLTDSIDEDGRNRRAAAARERGDQDARSREKAAAAARAALEQAEREEREMAAEALSAPGNGGENS